MGDPTTGPWIVLLLPFWLLRGRSYLKERLSRMAELDASVGQCAD